MSDRLHQTQTNHGGGYPFQYRSAQSQYEHGCTKKWTEDDLEMAGAEVSRAVGNRDEGYNDDGGGLLLQDFVYPSSSSSPHSFGSSTNAITRRRRRRQRKTINNNDNNNNNNMLLDESASSLVVHDGGGYYAPTSSPPPPPPPTSTARTASSRISSTQLWMTSSKHHKDLGEEAASLSSSTSPSKTRIVGKRRRGAWKAVSSFLSSMRSSSPLNMMTNRGLQPEEPSSLEEDDNDDINNGKNEWNTSTSTSVDVKKQLSILQQENDILRKQVTQLSQENQRLHQSHHRQRIILEQFEGEGQPMLDVNGDVIDSMWWEKNGYTEGGDYENGTIVVTSSTNEYNTVGNVGGGGEIAQVGGGEMITRGRKNVSTAVASSKDKKQPWQQQQRPPEQEECAPQDYNDGTCPIEPDISFRAALKDRAYWLVGLLTLQSMSGFILARNEELLQTHPVIVYFLTMLVGAGGNAGNQAAVRGK
jgi:Mg/Co/Ni transporter MgtE (contains CBS domain)